MLDERRKRGRVRAGTSDPKKKKDLLYAWNS